MWCQSVQFMSNIMFKTKTLQEGYLKWVQNFRVKSYENVRLCDLYEWAPLESVPGLFLEKKAQ